MRWLDTACADLAIAKITLPQGGMYEQLCFHAQQAVEKSIKAVLLKVGIDFPFTHNLQPLIDILPQELSDNPVLAESVFLNPYAVATRYPGEFEPVTEEEYLEALRIAENIVNWAQTIIHEK
ncbi:MAG: HEPN domain-containing protein [Armatimonadota bacterium]